MDRNGEILVSKIKKENPDEDIKEFAETAMNELLGWYGYGATRDEPSKIPISSCHSHPGSNSSDPDSPKYAEGCEWCGKPVDESKGLSSTGGTFCSELCFSQSRRANFKKNKTCDWCRHVRHTVSYVDFQDGASQLQFCSDKCLNQYKMHIFCRETRAHLEMHPHLPDDVSSTSGGGGLITPDMWLKNCKSPEPTNSSPPISPKITDSLPQTSPLPLITVAHPSKFMDTPETNKRQRNKILKKSRKRCTATVTCSPTTKSPPNTAEIPQDLRVRHTPPVGNFEDLQFRGEEQRTTNIYNRSFVDPFRNPHSHLFNGIPSPHSRFFNQPQLPPPPQPPPLPPLSNLLPPVTVLVPYPIIIPLPLPIPIPIPIPCDSKSKSDENIKNKENKSSPTVTAPSQNGDSSRLDAAVAETTTDDNIKTSDEKENVNETKSEQQDTEHTNNHVEVVNGREKPFRKRKRVVMESKSRKIGGSVKNKKSVPV